MKVAQVKNKMEEAGPYSAKGRKVEEGNTDREFGKGLEAVGESKKDLWGGITHSLLSISWPFTIVVAPIT